MVSSSGFKERISGRIPFLTKSETKVAQYILENYDSEELLKYNVSELAKNADVSDATIIRFCRSIGCTGYQDFKVNVAKDLIPREKQLDPNVEHGDDTKTICTKIFTAEINVLNDTLAELDFDLIDEIAEQINNARNLYIFGTGGSQIVAMDALHKFLKVGIRAYVYQDADLQRMSSSLAREGDVALCISFSGGNNSIISCMRNAKNNGAYTVGIISLPKSALVRHKLLDAVIYSAYDKTIFQSESVSTRIAQLAVIDSLVSKVAFMDYEKSLHSIASTRRATSENKI